MIIILGKTASGKDFIVNRLVEKYNYKKIITYTTRPMRKNETNHKTYHFVSDAEFKEKIDSGFFMEYKVYHTVDGDWYYGTAKEDIEHSDKNSIIILTPAGYIDFLKLYYNKIESKAYYIYSDEYTIRKRLEKRGDDKDELNRRIEHDNEDFKFVENFVTMVTNNPGDDVDDIIQEKMNINKYKPTLFLDVDGVIFNTVKAIVDLYDEDFSYYSDYKKIQWEDINTWNFTELNAASKEYIDQYFNQTRFFDKVTLFCGADLIIRKLKDKYNIKIVSHGYSPNLRLKKEFFAECFPFAEFIGVNLKYHKDKSCIDMSGKGDVFIDDNFKNLKTSNAETKICFGETYDWNREFDESQKNCFRCKNWLEVERLLYDRLQKNCR